MKNYNKTDYAANVTNEDAIVYRFADGTIKHITVDDFGGDEESFRKWKAVSDKDYYVEDRKTNNFSKKEVPLSVAGDLEKYSTPYLEDEYIDNQDEKALSSIMQQFISLLTDVQKRRLFLYAFSKKSFREIARAEGVDHKQICRCFTNILNKLKKFEKHMPQNAEKKTLSERINYYERLIKEQTETE